MSPGQSRPPRYAGVSQTSESLLGFCQSCDLREEEREWRCQLVSQLFSSVTTHSEVKVMIDGKLTINPSGLFTK